MGYRVPDLWRSIFSHDATIRTFPHLSEENAFLKQYGVLRMTERTLVVWRRVNLAGQRAEESQESARYQLNYRGRERNNWPQSWHGPPVEPNSAGNSDICWPLCFNCKKKVPTERHDKKIAPYICYVLKSLSRTLKYSRTKNLYRCL